MIFDVAVVIGNLTFSSMFFPVSAVLFFKIFYFVGFYYFSDRTAVNDVRQYLLNGGRIVVANVVVSSEVISTTERTNKGFLSSFFTKVYFYRIFHCWLHSLLDP